MFADGALAPDSQRRKAARAAWADLVGPGPTLTTAERHVVIATARAAWAGAPAPAGGSPVVAAAHRMAFDAVGMDRDVVAGYETAGLDRFRYTEVVGIVGRLANVDFYATGLGASLPELPGADDAGPTGDVAADAAVAEGLVPATGKLSALAVLDALPAEAASYRALHEPFYIPFREFMNAGYADELTRAQIEFVASRTSALNECFYWLLSHVSLLRASSDAAGLGVDIATVLTRPPPTLRGGAELAAMADALTTHPTVDPAAERAALVSAVGEQGAERAIGVCATFNMMNRTLDGGGVPIPATFDPLAVELGFDPAHVHH